MVDRVIESLRSEDSYKTALLIRNAGGPQAAADLFAETVMDLYWKAKDLPAAMCMGRAGILFCLYTAEETEDQDAADRLRSTAKRIAYNLGSFALVLWDEPGITITAADESEGYDAARLNLRLARELHKGDGPLSNAHWLTGAYHLCAGRKTAALEEFERGIAAAKKAGFAERVLLFAGYAALAHLDGIESAPGEREWNDALAGLQTQDSDEARSFVDQLTTARRVLYG